MRLLKLFRMVSKGFFMKLGKTEGWYQVIHVEDLTNLIMLAAVRPEARSEVIIAAGDEPMLISDMVKLIAEKIGRRVRIIQLPVWPFYVAADVCCAICRPFGISPPLYRRRVDFFTKDRRFDISKAKRLLDYQYKYDNERGIEETANWYLNQKLIS